MTPDALAKLVEQERAELAASVLVKLELGPPQMRCHWCGQMTNDVIPVYGPVHPKSGSATGDVRYKGRDCCGPKR